MCVLLHGKNIGNKIIVLEFSVHFLHHVSFAAFPATIPVCWSLFADLPVAISANIDGHRGTLKVPMVALIVFLPIECHDASHLVLWYHFTLFNFFFSHHLYSMGFYTSMTI